MRVLLRMEYTRTLDLDLELVLLWMVLDEVLVLGLAVPVVLPLGCLAVTSRLAAVHLVTSRLGVEFRHGQGAGPAWWSFLASLMLGAALLLWFFISNAGLISGTLIFYVGAPVGLLVGVATSLVIYSQGTRGSLNVVQDLCRAQGNEADMQDVQAQAHKHWRRIQYFMMKPDQVVKSHKADGFQQDFRKKSNIT